MPEIRKQYTDLDVCLCVLIVIIQNGVHERVKGKLAYTWLLKFGYADVACEGCCCTHQWQWVYVHPWYVPIYLEVIMHKFR